MLLLAGVWGCQGSPSVEASPSVEVADSAGVRVVTIAGSSPSDTLRPRQLWTHGETPPEYLFQRIVSGVLRDDGSVIIADAGSDEVVRIDPDGGDFGILARTGQGPREVRGPRKVVTGGPGDVWIEDFSGRKLLRVDGDSITTVLSGGDNPPASDRLMPIGLDSAGRIMMTTGGYMPGWEEEWLMGALVVFDPDESAVDTVGAFQFAERVGDPPVFPFSGYGVVSVTPNLFVTGRTDIPEIVWRSSNGAISQIARWMAEPRYADDRDWAEFEESMRQNIEQMNPGRSAAEYDAMAERSLAGWALDKTQPVRLFDDIVGARDGSVWIAPFTALRSVATAKEWIVMSAGGEWLGVVEFRTSTQVLDITEELILGIQVDELDVQTLVVLENPF